MTHTTVVDLAYPLLAPGGAISRLTLRLPPPVQPAPGADDIACLAAMTGISVELLAELDMDDAEKIRVAVRALANDAIAAGDLLPAPLKLVTP